MANRSVEAYAAAQTPLCVQNDAIPDSLFQEYGVYRGLRDLNGVGVLTGLTNISKIASFRNEGGKRVPIEGRLWYRGYDVKELIGSLGPEEFGFEKISYLLLFGDLPNQEGTGRVLGGYWGALRGPWGALRLPCCPQSPQEGTGRTLGGTGWTKGNQRM